jgi:hypothetical protein
MWGNIGGYRFGMDENDAREVTIVEFCRWVGEERLCCRRGVVMRGDASGKMNGKFILKNVRAQTHIQIPSLIKSESVKGQPEDVNFKIQLADCQPLDCQPATRIWIFNLRFLGSRDINSENVTCRFLNIY